MSMTQINEYYLYYQHTLHKNRIHIQTYYVIVSALYFVIILTKETSFTHFIPELHFT